MRSKEEIEATLAECIEVDEDIPMELDVFAYNAGWTQALKWILGEEMGTNEKKDISHLLEGANNDTITRALKRLSKDLGFGRKDNDVDSKNDNIRDGLLYAPIREKQPVLQQNSA